MPNEVKIKPEDDLSDILFEWEVDTNQNHKRTNTWYISMLLIATALIIYSIFTENFLFALIIILVVFILFIRLYTPNRKLKFYITDMGIVLGQEYIEFGKIHNFYIIYDPPLKKLFFTLKSFMPDLSVPLDNMNPLVIRETLLKYIDEDVEQELQSSDDQLETLLKL